MMYQHKVKRSKVLSNNLMSSQKPIYLFTQGGYEFYERGKRFYKVDKLLRTIIPVDR